MLRPFFVALVLLTASVGNAQASLKELSESTQWLRLLHFQQRSLGFASDVDSPAFFLSDQGKTEPLAELHATLKAFAEPSVIGQEGQHALCKYPARRWFLERSLPLELPKIDCVGYQRFLKKSKPKSISLVFASSYLGNPASAFGHSFLRFEPQDQRPFLLRETINFAAHTNGQRGLKYSVRGLTGGYQGRFSILPFYQQVNEHNHGALRDLWSYPLNLEDAEIDLLMAHLWELRHARFDYYFIDENCSSQLLALFDVLWPQGQLLAKAGVTVIPAEMLRLLNEQPGLLGEPSYQPALDVELGQRGEMLTPAQLSAVELLAAGKQPEGLAEQTIKQQAQLLDLAHDLLRLRWAKGQLEESVWKQRGQALLLPRAALAIKSPTVAVVQPPQKPTQAHGAARLRFGVRHSNAQPNKSAATALGWRLVFHDLLDPRHAQSRGAEIRALDTQVSISAGSWRLQSLDIVAMRSLRPRAGLVKPMSWQGRFGLRRDSALDDQSPLLGFAEGGRGWAWGSRQSLMFVMPLAELAGAKALEKSWRLQAGLQLGCLYTPTANTATLLELGYRRAIGGADDGSRLQGRLRQQWMLASSLGLRAELRRQRSFGNWATAAQLSLEWYW